MKSQVESRITAAPRRDVIALTKAEGAFYQGAGLALARFKGGALAGLWYVGGAMPGTGTVQEMATAALEAATAWLANADGEVWLAMASCYELCDPRRISLHDAASLAHLARRIGDYAISGAL